MWSFDRWTGRLETSRARTDSGERSGGSGKGRCGQIDLTALNNDVARLKSIVPSNSHIMEDVSFHYSNLWFAGQKKNWPLARFYFNETRNHIRWLIQKSPTAKTPEGEVVNLQGIFDGIDTSSLAMLKKSIEDKNREDFNAEYKLMLEACYACHKSAGRPYLRPMIPSVPPQAITNCRLSRVAFCAISVAWPGPMVSASSAIVWSRPQPTLIGCSSS